MAAVIPASDLEVERDEVGDFTVIVEWDRDGGQDCDPRQQDNASVMVCAHPRYNLGDVQSRGDEHDDYASLTNWLIAVHDADRETIAPLYLYEHSGISIAVGGRKASWFDDAGWDSGIVGFVFTTPATREATGVVLPHAAEAIEAEVREYDSFLRGEVYGFLVYDKDGEVVESCTGFLGDYDYAMREGKAVAEALRAHGLALATREAVGL